MHLFSRWKYSKMEPVRRRHMLDKASPEAQVIGTIVISGNYKGASPDQVRAARDIEKWADEERPKQVEVPACSRP
jgi:hypothetical protein